MREATSAVDIVSDTLTTGVRTAVGLPLSHLRESRESHVVRVLSLPIESTCQLHTTYFTPRWLPYSLLPVSICTLHRQAKTINLQYK